MNLTIMPGRSHASLPETHDRANEDGQHPEACQPKEPQLEDTVSARNVDGCAIRRERSPGLVDNAPSQGVQPALLDPVLLPAEFSRSAAAVPGTARLRTIQIP